MSEEIEILEEVTVVEVEEASANGLNVTTSNHAELDGLDFDDQHPIKAVIGLKTKLDEIESLKDMQHAKGRGYAEYRLWNKTPSKDDDWTGRFVALVPGKDTVELISATNYDIFGVTIPNNTAALAGSDEWETIRDPETNDIVRYESNKGSEYALVCLEGTVSVYCGDSNNINIGDYIKPGIDGFAVKNEDADGYYRVINKGDNYVVINLSLSASDVDNISVKHAKNADNYTDDGSIATKFNNIDIEIDQIIDGTTVVAKAVHSTTANDYTDDGEIKLKFDDIENNIDDVKENIEEDIRDIVDGTTVVAEAEHADIADNFIDGIDKEGKDIIRGIKEKFDSIFNGETFVATLQTGQYKEDLNFIAEEDVLDADGNIIAREGGWHPNPSGNYYYGGKKDGNGNYIPTEITLNTGHIVKINYWILKGMWIQDNDYIQILITPEKIFMRKLYNYYGRTQGPWMQIAGVDAISHTKEAITTYGGIPIPDDADLNKYIQCGNYYVEMHATALTLKNCPIESAGKLRVVSGVGKPDYSSTWIYLLQIYTTLDGVTFIRSIQKNGGTDWQFGNWKQIAGDINQLRGHGTNFSYISYPNCNIDGLDGMEAHYFVLNAVGTLPPNFCGHGFLDIDYFDGAGFAPSSNGAAPLTRQTLREYIGDKSWVRTYNHNPNSYVWSGWQQITGVKQSNFTFNHETFKVETEVGALFTAAPVSSTYYMFGDTIEGKKMELPFEPTTQKPKDFHLRINPNDVEASKYEYTAEGSWRILGLCGFLRFTTDDTGTIRPLEPIYLIQRIA